jgi:hypothetical protein
MALVQRIPFGRRLRLDKRGHPRHACPNRGQVDLGDEIVIVEDRGPPSRSSARSHNERPSGGGRRRITSTSPPSSSAIEPHAKPPLAEPGGPQNRSAKLSSVRSAATTATPSLHPVGPTPARLKWDETTSGNRHAGP